MNVDTLRPEPKPLITAEALAEMIDVSAEQVRTMKKRGQLPRDAAVVVPGLGLRFRTAKINTWLAGLAGEKGPRC